jgi:alkanesulfonate monooxygenase SsuD/methylene tetrahydromethanopterin reductase-like flavin-dependent oxidoreductase (luciferase family)
VDTTVPATRSRATVAPPLVSPEHALAYPYSAAEERAREGNRKRLFVGSPAGLRERLGGFAETVGADELMITSAIFDHEARLRSYELLAEAFELPA